jgi:hypothetical protein
MPNPKFDALQRQRQQSHADRLFGKEPMPAAPVPVPAPALDSGLAREPAGESDVVRKSYIILRGRIEALPSLELINRQGQTRLIPWHYFGGASLDHPGELLLFFDGPEGSCQITLKGRGLDQELLPGIKAQRVSLICELDDLAAAGVARSDPSQPVVTGIWIKGGNREWNRGTNPSR